MPAERPQVYFCGGSHLGTQGLPATQVFPVLVSRGLRAAWGQVSSRSVHAAGDPDKLPAELGPRLDGRSFILVVVPRNMFAVPLAMDLRLAVSRLGRRPMAAPQTFVRRSSLRGEARRRVLALGRWAAGWGVSLGELPNLRERSMQYGRAMDSAVDFAFSKGCRLAVWATPVPLEQSRYPGSWFYQAAIAATIRHRASERVVIADVYTRLRRAESKVQLNQDALHLTAAGHRIVADAILEAILGSRRPSPDGIARTEAVHRPAQ